MCFRWWRWSPYVSAGRLIKFWSFYSVSELPPLCYKACRESCGLSTESKAVATPTQSKRITTWSRGDQWGFNTGSADYLLSIYSAFQCHFPFIITEKGNLASVQLLLATTSSLKHLREAPLVSHQIDIIKKLKKALQFMMARQSIRSIINNQFLSNNHNKVKHQSCNKVKHQSCTGYQWFNR